MKKVLFLTAMVLGVFCSIECRGQEKPEGTMTVATLSMLKDLEGYVATIDKANKRAVVLAKMAPVSGDVLQAPLPAMLLGLQRQKISVTEASPTDAEMFVEATYSNEDVDQSIVVEIFDGVGNNGSGVYLSTCLLLADLEATDTQFTQKINVNRTEMLIAVRKDLVHREEKITISFIHKDRYVVLVKGRVIPYNELVKAIDELDLSHLK